MLPNKVIWKKCEHCGIEWNGYQFYPLDLVANTAWPRAVSVVCPKCRAANVVTFRLTYDFNAEQNPQKAAESEIQKA